MSITTTDQTKALNKALLKAQQTIEAVSKDSTNPHFKTKYASLSSVLDAVKVPLNENGILITQAAAATDSSVLAVTTRLTHAESSEHVEITIPIPLEQPTAQKVGSATTYGRRYGLETLLGLAEADDDGHGASQRPNGTTAAREPEQRKLDWQAVSDRMRGEIAACETVAELEEWGQANGRTKDQMPAAVGDRINEVFIDRLNALEMAPAAEQTGSDLDIPDALRREQA